jgi:chorismate mutase/ribosomal protein S18 acetylase RimI-like enzyme
MPTDPDVVARVGQPEDAAQVADLFTAVRVAAVPDMPPPVHTAAENLAWLTDQLSGAMEPWIAEQDGLIVGFMLLEGDRLHSLYVHEDRTGEGIGTLLLDVAKSQRPEGLQLWVFESNTRAQRMYARHGFVVVERTDGSGNEEQAPDVRMVWPGSRAAAADIGALRRAIDKLDDQLAALLDERARLTAKIQARKAVPGHAGRDVEREAEIVSRMAEQAPHLGEDGVRRIMHTVISVSLDAADLSGGGGAPAP